MPEKSSIVSQYSIAQAPYCEGLSSVRNIRQECQFAPPNSLFCAGRSQSNVLRVSLRETQWTNIQTLRQGRQSSNISSHSSYNINDKNLATSPFYHWEIRRPPNSNRFPNHGSQRPQGFQQRNINLVTPVQSPPRPRCISLPPRQLPTKPLTMNTRHCRSISR